jgi:hypothetical protein
MERTQIASAVTITSKILLGEGFMAISMLHLGGFLDRHDVALGRTAIRVNCSSSASMSSR